MDEIFQHSTLNKREVNKARLEIITIIDQLFEDGTIKSIPHMLLALKYPKLMEDGKIKPNAGNLIHHLRHPDSYSKYSDRISFLEFTDFLEALKRKFPAYPRNIIFDEQTVKILHDDYYIYYYESYSSKKEYFIKPALIGFDKDSSQLEWKGGKIYYINDDFSPGRTFTLTRIRPKEKNRDFLFFMAKNNEQVNFFTVKILKRTILKRGVLPLTYSVTETMESIPCAGKGLLERIDSGVNYIDIINEIRKKGIRKEISNALYHSKLVFEAKVDENKSAFTTNQMEALDRAKGIWSGVHLRTDFDKSVSDRKSGGLCKFILLIEASGQCELFWGKEGSEFKSYKGFIECPFDGSSSFLKIYLEFLKEEKTYKLYLFLSLGTKSKFEYSYKGVISGWMNKDKKIYASSVYMKKISELDENYLRSDVQQILSKEKPTRISQLDITQLKKISNRDIKALKIIEQEHLAMFTTCMPT